MGDLVVTRVLARSSDSWDRFLQLGSGRGGEVDERNGRAVNEL